MEEIIRQIRAELAILTARVTALEESAPAPLPKFVPPAIDSAETIGPLPLKDTVKSSPSVPAAAAKSPSEPIGGKLLGGAAVICFLLAAIFLIRLAVDHGWLTPQRQIGLAAMFGGSLIGAGFALRNSDAPYASILPGAGLTILWACVYAAYGLFGLISQPSTVVLLWILCGLSYSFFRSFKQSYFLFVMVVGAYTIPLFLHPGHPHMAQDQLHFLVWDLLFCFLAIRLQSRRLITLAAYFALIIYYSVNTQPVDLYHHKDLSLAAFQFLQLVIFGAFLVRFSARYLQPMTESEAWYFAPVLLFFYGTEFYFVYQVNPAAAPLAAIFFAAMLAAAQIFAQGILKTAVLPSRVVVVSMISVILFHAVYVVLLPPAAGHWLSLALLLFWPLIEKRGLDFRTYPVPVIAFWLIIAIEFCKAFQTAGHGTAEISEILFSGIYTVLLLIAYFRVQTVSPDGRRLSDGAAYMLIGGASLQAWLCADRIANYAASGSTAQMVISALVAGYAFILMALARTYRDRSAANGALVVFIAVSLKILIVDLAESAPLLKIVTLIVVGALLYGGGMLSRQIRPAA